MAVREIVLFPNPILKDVCRPVDLADPELPGLVADLIDTVQASPGVGLAAPQIGVAKRAIVVDVSPKPGNGLIVLLNPEIVSAANPKTGREGCLSIPDFTANVRRAQEIVIRGLTPQGQTVVLQSENLEAVCLQHEVDHLDGILFLDRVASLKRDVFRRKGFEPRFEAQEYARNPLARPGEAGPPEPK
jgi:peptide deformylase